MNQSALNWETFLKHEKNFEYARDLQLFLDEEYRNYKIYPPRELLFNAFKITPLTKVKVIIIGQDPYHEPGQAMGLSFSVPDGIPLPMSLINIYKEIEQDIGIKMNFSSGNLTHWAQQGVLLLNAFLTVRQSQPLSHRHAGYIKFFEHVLTYLNSIEQPFVFLLWGSFARSYRRLLTNPHHLILEAVHPSPLAANRGGWFGNRHFSKTNDFLRAKGVMPIRWENTTNT